MRKTVTGIMVYCMMAVAVVCVCLWGDRVDVRAAAGGKKLVMKQSKVTLAPGGKFKLKVKKAKPSKLGCTLTYKSSRKAVATVNSRGVVRAKKAGWTKVTIAARKNRGIKTTVKVVVRAKKKTAGKTGSVADRERKLSVGSSMPHVAPESPASSPAPSFEPVGEPSKDPSNEPSKEPSKEPSDEPQEEIRLFGSLPEMYFDMMERQFSLALREATVSRIVVDLSDCANLSDADKADLSDRISREFGKETVQKTMDELKADGVMVEDATYGFVFRESVFIKISEGEKDSQGFDFRIHCALNGLSASGYSQCRAFAGQDNTWYYTLDGRYLS